MGRIAMSAALVCLATCGFGCTSAGPPDEYGRRSAGIVGGAQTTSWDSVVFLYVDGVSCTGVVVAPEVVLTAAQCLDGAHGPIEVLWTDDIFGGAPDHTRMSTDYHIHPQYNPLDHNADVAAILLADVSPTDPIPIHCAPPDASWVDPANPLTVAGYGSADFDPGNGGLKVEAPIGFEAWDDQFLLHADAAHGFCYGDAGAPALTDHPGDWRVAAVASQWDETCTGWGAASRLDPHVAWLEGLVPGWDVCGGGGDDDDSAGGDDDDSGGGDDDSGGGDDDTTAGDDDSAGGDDDDVEDDDVTWDDDGEPDCSCRKDGERSVPPSALPWVLGALALAVVRRGRHSGR